MRVCADEADLREAFFAVQRLSAQHFRNEGVFMEKYIPQARHIEVQLFGNRFGEIVTIGERDCTLQRRNQKVLEECPAACLRTEVREALHKAAHNLASIVGYRSAGTVEFLYEPSSESFYFLEVNTRLQVEHGVTEEVYGIDLVEWMVREACDEMPNLAAQVRVRGTVFRFACMPKIRGTDFVRVPVASTKWYGLKQHVSKHGWNQGLPLVLFTIRCLQNSLCMRKTVRWRANSW
ncbi:hypothetical protein GCM10025858_31780 [Alicyclobacillus sacchari]|nr:hypothetical protein GCM10025858_31780 [Alicyclobacillus sacchari]